MTAAGGGRMLAGMRGVAALAAVVGLAAAAPASAAPRVTVDPPAASLGERVTIAGRGWPVFENCSRIVRLRLESDQNALPIDRVRVTTRGRFRVRWTPRASEVGPGAWRVVARMRCESGKDGSPFIVRRSAGLHLH